MTTKAQATYLKDLLQDGDEVQTTVFDLGQAQICLTRKNDLSLLSVSGTYSPALAKEIEKVAIRCPGSIGIEFREIQGDPRGRRPLAFDSSVLALFKSLRKRCHRKEKEFFLCTPPPKLQDLLKLAGVLDEYPIVDSNGSFRGGRQSASTTKVGTRTATRTAASAGKRSVSTRERREPTRIFHLNQSLKRTESLEKGLDSAAKCVEKLLPQEPPECEGYGFVFAYNSSEKVGGDFFDFVRRDDQNLGVSQGDVSGHGIDAALVMGIGKKLINVRSLDPRFGSPSDVLRQVNRDLRGDLGRSTFITALYGNLHLPTGTFRFARAGHEFPILFYPGGEQRILKSKGMALGMGAPKMFDAQIEDVTIRLQPGQCLLLCTDGLSECRNRREAIYSRERLAFELTQIDPRESDAQAILDHLLDSIRRFADGRSQEDDMTAILIQRAPDAAPGTEPTAGPPVSEAEM